MIRFGVVGTGWITDAFIKGASLDKDFKLCAVYSRSAEKAKEFAKKYSVENIFTDLEEMAKSNLIDAVYIASPNSLHAEQSMLFMNHKKHVLCEKPLASNSNEVKNMIKASRDNNVALMEALKTGFLPNFKAVKENLDKLGEIRRIVANFCQYSSRYDSFKEGRHCNVFDPAFSGGSLMDIGIYCTYFIMSLFGVPKDVIATGEILGTGVDGQGTLCLQYDGMEGVVIHSKITDSVVSSEIQGEAGNMVINKISVPRNITIYYRGGNIQDISRPQIEDDMYYEAAEFINLIKAGKVESDINSHKLSLSVMEVLDKARKQIGVIFPADKKI